MEPALGFGFDLRRVYPLESPVYDELETLNGLGLLATYIDEVRPVSRIEVARLTIEARRALEASEDRPALASTIVAELEREFEEEVRWLNDNQEDRLPTLIHPVERIDIDYIYSSGSRREMNDSGSTTTFVRATEATPLIPNNDDLPTSPGSNEVLRGSGWAGAFSAVTVYGEASLAGPITGPVLDYQRSVGADRVADVPSQRARLVAGGAVFSLGNLAVSGGWEEMAWGAGHFAVLSQGDNARPFGAIRLRNIHPSYLPGVLRYLGPFRAEAFFGQLDHGRAYPAKSQFAYSRPWIDGEVIAFKPLPFLEFGLDHAITFGGRGNSNYGMSGFVGRASGLSTGDPHSGNTNSRAGIFFKVYFPRLHGAYVYQEILGEDNLTREVPAIGRFLPFLAVSYQGGICAPRVTEDGMTSARFEWTITEPNYSTHNDSLYWSYDGRLMGDPIGPDASEIDLSVGRWLDYHTQLEADAFVTERAPRFDDPAPLQKERSAGFALALFRLPVAVRHIRDSLVEVHGRLAVEYVSNMNFTDRDAVRVGLLVSLGLTPHAPSMLWRQ